MSIDPNDPDNGRTGHWQDVEAISQERRPQELAPASGQDNANLIYILYLVNFAVPFLGIVGVIMAYSARDRAGPELRSHYDNQIRIFWTTVIGYIVSAILFVVFIGIIMMLAVFVWKIVRVATAMSLLSRGAPVRNVQSLSFTSE